MIIIGIFISLAVLAGATFYISYSRGTLAPMQTASEEVAFTVAPEQDVAAIAQALSQQGLISSPFYFTMYVHYQGIDRRLQHGAYTLNKNMSIRDIARALSQGDARGRERVITIIEGWRISDMAEYLVKEGAIASVDELTAMAARADNCDRERVCTVSFVADIPAGSGLEGYLFPDTYRIFKDAETPDIIAKMLNTMDAKLTEDMRQAIVAQNKSLHDIITMASIIEKEVRTAEDMRIVSGIFWNRLDIGMALQSDATLSYALNDKKPAHALAELEFDSPYNTYKYRGLPPGPIASPGLNAITAAVYPDETDYLYFLSNLETGQTYFAETLDEHNRNKQLYLR